MIIDQAIYRHGRREACEDLSDAVTMLREEDEGFVWVGLKDPSDAEFALVNTELDLHPLAVEDAVSGNQRPKADIYDETMLVVLKTLRYIEASSDIETGEVMVFVGDRFVVTVRRGEGNPLAGVRLRLEANPEQLELGPGAVLHAITDSVVDNYIAIDIELARDLDAIEEEVFSGTLEVDPAEIYRLKREVLEYRRAAEPLLEAMRTFHGHKVRELIHPDCLPFFRDVEDHLHRVNDHARTYDRLLTDVLHAHLAQLQVQQNEDMRKISAMVALAAVPTMIAGIYGMNFAHMPELEESWGYPAVLLLMLGACGFIYHAFRKANWL
ncbi:MAG TPA: magnesium and cobalt transport protein CorA [Candidatus Lustribacter sp.]|nr:magnesium and cobalt transport protein CorA [Candidatus Lustribacter sp.]